MDKIAMYEEIIINDVLGLEKRATILNGNLSRPMSTPKIAPRGIGPASIGPKALSPSPIGWRMSANAGGFGSVITKG